MNSHFRHLIQAATATASKSVEGTEGEKFDPEGFQQRLIEEIKKVTQQPISGSGVLNPAEYPNTLSFYNPAEYPSHLGSLSYNDSRDRETKAIIEQLETYPDEEEGQSSYQVLQTLTPLAQSRLQKFATDEIRSRKADNYVGLWVSDGHPVIEQLENQGLVQRTDETDNEGKRLSVLTPMGRKVSRLLSAKGRPPHWLVELAEARGGNEP